MEELRFARAMTEAARRLSVATSLSEVTSAVADAARELASAEGATFILRDGVQCFYVDEDAISPLWKGRKFPLKACVSGWVIQNCELAVIPDIYSDDRVPVEVYRPTFVKSMAMVPIRQDSPLGAVGVYWAETRTPTASEIKYLQALADFAAASVECIQLRAALARSGRQETA